MSTRHTRPPFSSKPVYVCPTCGKALPMGGWQAEYDYQDHLAAHAWWAAVRAEAVAVATWPVLLAVGLYATLTGRWGPWLLAGGIWLAALLTALLLGR